MWSAINQAACWVWTDSTDWLVHLNFTVSQPHQQGIWWRTDIMDSSSVESIKLSACVWLEQHSLSVTQDAACEPNGKPASFQGFESVFLVLCFFRGTTVWMNGWRRKDEKERRRIYSFDFTVRAFPGSIVRKNMMEVYHRHSTEVKRVAFLMSVLYVCNFVVVCVWIC